MFINPRHKYGRIRNRTEPPTHNASHQHTELMYKLSSLNSQPSPPNLNARHHQILSYINESLYY